MCVWCAEGLFQAPVDQKQSLFLTRLPRALVIETFRFLCGTPARFTACYLICHKLRQYLLPSDHLKLTFYSPPKRDMLLCQYATFTLPSPHWQLHTVHLKVSRSQLAYALHIPVPHLQLSVQKYAGHPTPPQAILDLGKSHQRKNRQCQILEISGDADVLSDIKTQTHLLEMPQLPKVTRVVVTASLALLCNILVRAPALRELEVTKLRLHDLRPCLALLSSRDDPGIKQLRQQLLHLKLTLEFGGRKNAAQLASVLYLPWEETEWPALTSIDLPRDVHCPIVPRLQHYTSPYLPDLGRNPYPWCIPHLTLTTHSEDVMYYMHQLDQHKATAHCSVLELYNCHTPPVGLLTAFSSLGWLHEIRICQPNHTHSALRQGAIRRQPSGFECQGFLTLSFLLAAMKETKERLFQADGLVMDGTVVDSETLRGWAPRRVVLAPNYDHGPLLSHLTEVDSVQQIFVYGPLSDSILGWCHEAFPQLRVVTHVHGQHDQILSEELPLILRVHQQYGPQMERVTTWFETSGSQPPPAGPVWDSYI